MLFTLKIHIKVEINIWDIIAVILKEVIFRKTRLRRNVLYKDNE